MKNLTHIIIILAITGSCIQPNRAKKDTTDIESEPINTVMKFEPKKVNTPQKTLPDTSWIYPPFLTADFNGDSHIDTAFAILMNNPEAEPSGYQNKLSWFLCNSVYVDLP